MRALVLGAGGQLGRILRRTNPFPETVFLERAAADLCDGAAIERALQAVRPELVINAAAFTAVDRAESAPSLAYAVNESGIALLAADCAARGSRLIHLSTDHVFAGSARRPYRPDDEARPCNVYGASKLAGEERVRETPGLHHLIIRTSWVYSEVGRNFLLTLLDLARRQGQVRVVADQIGSPTSAWSLAEAVWRAARLPDCAGTAHFTDGGAVSRHELAVAIFAEAAAQGLPIPCTNVEAIDSIQFAAEHPAAAPRPAYGVLDSAGLRARLGCDATDWRAALRAVIARLDRGAPHV